MSKRSALIAGILCAGGMIASAAEASEPRTHDGFFLRAGLNVGPLRMTQKYELDGQEQDGENKYSGITPGIDLMAGATPVKGLVIGGALIMARTSDPDVEIGSLESTADGTLLFTGVGLFGDYYLNPAKGLHFQGLLGISALDFAEEESASGNNDPTGGFIGAGVGYDFWLGDEWSIGPFGRLIYGAFSNESGVTKAKESYLFPSIGVAFTMH